MNDIKHACDDAGCGDAILVVCMRCMLADVEVPMCRLDDAVCPTCRAAGAEARDA